MVTGSHSNLNKRLDWLVITLVSEPEIWFQTVKLRLIINVLHSYRVVENNRIFTYKVNLFMIKDLLEQLKSKMDSGSIDSSEEVDPNSPITQFTTDKIKAVVAELANAKPTFLAAGFSMEQLEVEVGLIPKVSPQFVQFEKISREKESELLNQLEGQKLLKFVLQSLFKSSRMDALMESTELSLHAIEIDVSVPPSVRTIFKRQQIQPSSQSSEQSTNVHPITPPDTDGDTADSQNSPVNSPPTE